MFSSGMRDDSIILFLCLEGQLKDLAANKGLSRENHFYIKDAVLFDQSPERENITTHAKVERLCCDETSPVLTQKEVFFFFFC